MTGLEKLEAYEMKIRICNEQKNRCKVCGEFMYFPQIAHRIPKTKAYLKRWGKEIIHHRLNLVAVCGLRCNAAVLLDPATHPIEAEALVEQIRSDLWTK